MTETKHAYAYLRVSGTSQIEGDGFERQLAACTRYATEHGFEIVKVYREEGVTGKSELDDRPALQELIADLLSNGTRTVIIEKLDRLARKVIVQETILEDLQRRGITIISAAEPDLIDDDPTRTLIRQILGAFFEYERKMIVSKLRSARERKKARGEHGEGIHPFGSLPGEDVALARIMELTARGLRSEEITRTMNDSAYNNPHFKTRSGKPWRGSVIRKILAREKSKHTFTSERKVS